MLNRYYSGPPSDHFDGHRFFNPHHPNTDRSLLQLLRWRFGGKRATWPATTPGRQVVPERRVDGLRITMIGHATVLIQTARRNLLVDPVWSERASPLGFAGPKRVSAPGVAFEQLPPIDIVLLTHNHYDHLDVATMQRLWARDRPRIIAPLGNDAVVARSRPEIVIETRDWREKVEIGGGVTVWLHPAHHWSARGIADRRMALWSGYVIETPVGVVYVSGDTGYGDGRIFLEVPNRFPVIDVAVLPIGAYEPRWFMKDQHVNPAEAVRIMQDCGARQALGVHWGAFPLTDEAWSDPVGALAEALAEAGIEPTRFLPLEPGQQWDCPGPDRRHTGRQVPPTPPETTAPFPAASPTDQPENKEQDDRAQRGVDEEGDYPCAEVDTQPRQQPISDERPDTANDQVANEALAATARDVASKPPGGARFLERMGLNSAVAEKPAQVYQLPTCIAESVTTASSRYQAAASRDEQPISTMAAASPQGRTCAVAISSTGVDGGGHSRILPPSAFGAREPPSIRQRSCSGRQHCKAS